MPDLQFKGNNGKKGGGLKSEGGGEGRADRNCKRWDIAWFLRGCRVNKRVVVMATVRIEEALMAMIRGRQTQ